MIRDFNHQVNTRITDRVFADILRILLKSEETATQSHPAYTSKSDFYRTALVMEKRRAINDLGLRQLDDFIEEHPHVDTVQEFIAYVQNEVANE